MLVVIILIIVFLVVINMREDTESKLTNQESNNFQNRHSEKDSLLVEDRASWSSFNSRKGLSENSRWQTIRQQVIKRDGHKCTSCGSVSDLTVDHIKELSLGGSNNLENLRTLCAECHQDKHRRRFLERGFDANDDYGENYQASPKIIALNKAMRTGESLGIKYVDAQGLYSERVILPKEIYKSKHVPVDAYCELDKTVRVFRVSRMKLCMSRLNYYNNATNSYTSTWDADKVRRWKLPRTVL